MATDNGTVKITGTDDRMKVSIDGGDILIENVGKPITIRAGRHNLLVTRDGLTVKTEAFEISRGLEKVLEVTYTRPKPDELAKAETPKATGSEPGLAPPAAAKSSAAAAPVNPSPRNEPEYIITVAGRIKLRLIPAVNFMMGSDDGRGDSDEHPRHPVRITRPFYLGVYELTQRQFKEVMGRNPSYFSSEGPGKERIAGASTDAHPVEGVSWADAVLFCNKLSEKEGLKAFYQIDGETVTVLSWSGDGYRLPTEAEWEYAAGGDPEDLGGSAWYDRNSGNVTHPVGQKRPNRFGLYDVLGNVWEWCWDGYDEGYYKLSPSEDPRGPSEVARRVVRGGSYDGNPRYCRSADRYPDVPEDRGRSLGFRVARAQSGQLTKAEAPKAAVSEPSPASPAAAKSSTPAAPVNLAAQRARFGHHRRRPNQVEADSRGRVHDGIRCLRPGCRGR